jgi:hypothetical protein
MSVGFAFSASLVFIYFALDDVAGFGNLVSNTVVFFGAGLPGFVTLIRS